MLQQLLANQVLWTALLASGAAQLLKLLLLYVRTGKLDFRVLTQTGGMPSSHASLVSALAMGVGLQEGWNSLLFATTVVFALIVMYDAAGIRQAAGKHARVINRMVDELFESDRFQEPYLKELLGHTPLQVVVGSLLGIGCVLVDQILRTR